MFVWEQKGENYKQTQSGNEAKGRLSEQYICDYLSENKKNHNNKSPTLRPWTILKVSALDTTCDNKE